MARQRQIVDPGGRQTSIRLFISLRTTVNRSSEDLAIYKRENDIISAFILFMADLCDAALSI